ncbi:SUMF1/EgtB/PvdO family nonheme iron enzyme [Rhodobacter sp. NSM]|uniref:SUMF1/EgtB/PvdO family nonheme iron enzyme n=1 Tax=Rhodobacter sp. NSM TaxID=3457501 RepID=UPI003FD09FC1
MPFTISVPDVLRQSVEAATGGRNTVLYDDKGFPSVMHVIPKFQVQDIDASLGTGVHPAFVVGGVETSEIFVARYLASIHDSRAMSLPGYDPAAGINFDTAVARCSAKGPGWHLMTNAEWAAIALWCSKNGFLPRGNTTWGKSHANGWESASRPDGNLPGVSSGTGRTRTGKGPVGWNHDNSASGIADLCGNVWEWSAGLRLVDGEIQILANNDAAATGADLSPTSTAWRAILQNGSLVAPGTANTLKFDATGVGGTGSPQLATAITSQSDGSSSASQTFSAITAAAGVTIPPILKALALMPVATTGMDGSRLYMRNLGERMPIRGGSWGDGASAGVWALHANSARSNANPGVGFRPAFVI